jgi:hypothetical protein
VNNPDTTQIWTLHNPELFFKQTGGAKSPCSPLLNIKRKKNLYEPWEPRKEKKLEVLLDPFFKPFKVLRFHSMDSIESSLKNSARQASTVEQHYRRSSCFTLSKFTTSLGWWCPHRTLFKGCLGKTIPSLPTSPSEVTPHKYITLGLFFLQYTSFTGIGFQNFLLLSIHVHARTIPLHSIAERTRLSIEGLEYKLMKSLSSLPSKNCDSSLYSYGCTSSSSIPYE